MNSAGNVTVTAHNDSSLLARVSNESTAAASALVGASSTNYSGILASNMVSSAARAYIEQSETGGSTTSVTAAGNVTIDARDAASIDAKTELRGATSTSNDGGLGIINGLASTLLDRLPVHDGIGRTRHSLR